MRHFLRKVAALGFWAGVTITTGLASPGCTNRLGPVQATQTAGGMGHANLPDIFVEQAKECVAFDGRQLEKGRIVVESTVDVNEDGDKLGVTVVGIPETARDFGVCLRKLLQDMPIAEQPFREAVDRLNFHREHAMDSQEALEQFINVILGVPFVESELVLEVDEYTVVLPVTVKVRADREKLIDRNEAALEKVGQQALDSLGYDEIMRRAKQVGWLETVRKTQAKAPADKGLIAQSETEVVVVMFEVFTTHAVTAGVVSQLDSPLPGPADLAALGILTIGLYKAGAVAINALITATAPAPTASTPPPPPGPTPQVPPPPLDCPRNESFTPDRTDDARGCTHKSGKILCYSRKHPPCMGVHTHGWLNYQVLRRGVCVAVKKKAVRCDGPFTISGPCGSVSTVECGTDGTATSGIFED